MPVGGTPNLLTSPLGSAEARFRLPPQEPPSSPDRARPRGRISVRSTPGRWASTCRCRCRSRTFPSRAAVTRSVGTLTFTANRCVLCACVWRSETPDLVDAMVMSLLLSLRRALLKESAVRTYDMIWEVYASNVVYVSALIQNVPIESTCCLPSPILSLPRAESRGSCQAHFGALC